MADKRMVQDGDSGEVVIARAKDFWEKYGKILTIASVIVIIAAGSFYLYNEYVKKPKEKKAVEVMYKAEEYFRMDSVSKALNGDGQHAGFLKVISQYGGTKAGKMAQIYAASCYIKLNDNDNALKHLKKFSSSSKPVQARAYNLIADAYADKGNYKEAFDYYKKAGTAFADDEPFSARCLFLAAYLAQKNLNDPKAAIELYKQIKDKYPRTQQGYDADNYLAQLGVYNTD
jgi:tetratricopeptide (TPR) repeat protein